MKKILLLLALLVSCIGSIIAQMNIDIFYKDGDKTHYACRYCCTTLDNWTDSNGIHIDDYVYIYGHIRQVEEDYDNLLREISLRHPYAILYYNQGDALLGYHFDIALNKQYIESINRS